MADFTLLLWLTFQS